MNIEHNTIDKFCPHCLNQLTIAISTGHIFCDTHEHVCGYEFLQESKQPLSQKEAKQEAKRRIRKVLNKYKIRPIKQDSIRAFDLLKSSDKKKVLKFIEGINKLMEKKVI